MEKVLPTRLPHHLVHAKNTFVQNLKLAELKNEPWAENSNEVFSRYLKDVYNINVPEDFHEQLELATNEHFAYSRKFFLSYKHLDAVIKSCLEWLDFLENSKEVFDELVCKEVLSMARIHTSVISGRNIGNQPGIRLKKSPPHLLVTIVTIDAYVRVIS